LLNCPIGKGGNTSNNLCEICDGSCSSCTYAADPNSCVSCPDGRYISGTTCPLCNNECLTCNGGNSNNCLTCTGLRYFENNSCVLACSTGYYENIGDNTC